MARIMIEFDIPNEEYAVEGITTRTALEMSLAADLQALLYDNGEGATRDALRGGFKIVSVEGWIDG